MLTKEQIKERKNYIGGSDVHHVLNLEPYGCARYLWYDKKGYEPEYELKSREMDRGNFYEKTAIGLFCNMMNLALEPHGDDLFTGLSCCRTREFAIANVDAIIVKSVPGKIETGRFVLEVKCPNPYSMNKIIAEGIPYSWSCQMQHYLHVFEYEYGYFMIFNCVYPEESIHFRVDRDQNLIAMIVKSEKVFWSMVQENKKPDPLPNQLEEQRCKHCVYKIECMGADLVVEPDAEILQMGDDNDFHNAAQEYENSSLMLKQFKESKEAAHKIIVAKMGKFGKAKCYEYIVKSPLIEQVRWDTKALDQNKELVKKYKNKKSIYRKVAVTSC